uniref:Alcohol dehydrogenase [NADP(+)] A n=1 Tax=Lygus hesperus TaxID=30085 RepID=A0A0A9YLF6_LYGHE
MFLTVNWTGVSTLCVRVHSRVSIVRRCVATSTSKRGILDKINPFKDGKGDAGTAAKACPPIKCCDDVVKVGAVEIPMFGYGTWQLYPPYVESSIEYALDIGIRHIDTSITFTNLQDIGTALQKLFKCGKYRRDEIFLSGKLPYYSMKPEEIPRIISQYLEQLKVDYLDLFMIHYPVGVVEDKCSGEYLPDPATDHIAVWKEMEGFVSRGCIKSLGLSNFNICQIQKILENASIKPVNLQTELHVYNQECDLVKFACGCGISVTAYAPLGSPGLIQHLFEISGGDNCVGYPLGNFSVERIGRKYRKTSANILLRFLLKKGIIVIPKSEKPDRICSNFNVFDFELDSCDMEELEALDKGKYGKMFTNNVWQGTDKHPEYPFEKT